MPPASHVFQYDSNGNVRRSLGNYRALNAQGVAAATNTVQDNWYRYDAMNRMATAKGQLISGAIVRGTTGVDIFYRGDGQRAYTLTNQNRREDYAYDNAGRVLEVRNGASLTAPGAVVGVFVYDALGRLVSQVDTNNYNGQVSYTRSASYNAKNQLISDDVSLWQNDDINRTLSTYTYGAGADYALGAVTQIDALTWKDGTPFPTTRTINTYLWRDGAQQAWMQYDPNIAVAGVNTSSYNYAIIGGQAQLASVSIQDGCPRNVIFVNDFLGQAVRRDEAGRA
jgi:trimeric autotransporter adhesin